MPRTTSRPEHDAHREAANNTQHNQADGEPNPCSDIAGDTRRLDRVVADMNKRIETRPASSEVHHRDCGPWTLRESLLFQLQPISGQQGGALPVDLVLGDYALASKPVQLLDLVGDAEARNRLLPVIKMSMIVRNQRMAIGMKTNKGTASSQEFTFS